MSPKSVAGALMYHSWKVDKSPFYTSVGQSHGPSNIVCPAGQIGRRDGITPSDPEEQIRLAFDNLRRCLEAAGARIEDIIKMTYYIVGYDHTKPRHRQAYLDFVGDHRPATTLVPVPALAMPEIIFEVEAIAAIPQAPIETVDVVVVGAGLSGLQAAVDLHKAGLKVRVLEARDRVGGKTYSVPAQGSVCDVGAAWINDTNQWRMSDLAKRYNLDLIIQNTEGDIVVDDGIGNHKKSPYGQLLSDSDDESRIADVIRIRDLLEEACQKIDTAKPVASSKAIREDLDSITFEDWIASQAPISDDALNSLKVGTRAILGIEPSEVSALYILDYCKAAGGYMQMRSDHKSGGQYMRVAQGTQSFSKGLAGELPTHSVKFMSPVRKIEQRAGSVRVTSARGIYDAARVVVSVPTPLYQEIEFSPPLPDEKQQLSQSTRLGDYCKAIVFYKSPWWRKHGLTGMSQSVKGPYAVTRDTSVDADSHYSLTCFIVGQPARDWMKLSRSGRDRAVLDQLQKIYSPFATLEEPIEVVEQMWQNEQWSQGCPCPVMVPGDLSKFESVLRAPVGRIHFVGTETAFEWKGYMHGACESGERGAKEILLAMNKAKM